MEKTSAQPIKKNMKNKPFKLRPSGKDYLWGGQKLNEEYAKNIDMNPLAETWECSTHPDGPSYVVGGEFDGKELACVFQTNPALLGCRHSEQDGLPIIIKLIDAKEDLSVQVHPTDEYADANENGQLGKTEMWYILDSAENASIVYGLRRDCSKSELAEAISNDSIGKYLNRVKIKKGEVYFIPAGTIHAIGAGCVIAEIQESSNLTYRLYDYGRKDKNGEKRPLHIDKALQVAKLDGVTDPKQPMRVLKYEPGIAIEQLSRCEYFDVYRILVNNERASALKYLADELSYRVLLCVEGNGEMACGEEIIDFRKGECIFVPANSVEISISGQAELLDIRG